MNTTAEKSLIETSERKEESIVLEEKEYKFFTAGDIINNNFEIEELHFDKYLPFRQKQEVISAILDMILEKEDEVLTCDVFLRYLSFNMLAISAYVKNIDFGEDYVKCFDSLSKSKKLQDIIKTIGEDFVELNKFFEMEYENRMKYNNIENVLNRKISEIDFTLVTGINNIVENVTKVGSVMKDEAAKAGLFEQIKKTLSGTNK